MEINQPSKPGQELVLVYGAKVVRLGLSVRTKRFERNRYDTKFDLEIETSKTRIFPFGRNSKTKDNFDFLGFNIYNSKSRNGYYMVGYKTSEKKSKQKKQKIKEHIKVNRGTKPKELVKQLNKILTGNYNYYGISFNFNWLVEIYNYTLIQLKKWLGRRCQRGKMTWEKYRAIIEYNPLAKPRITYKLW